MVYQVLIWSPFGPGEMDLSGFPEAYKNLFKFTERNICSDVNDKKKKIIVALPPVEIADVEVDPGSLDYIFIDSSANTPDVSITSLPACKADAQADCQSNKMLFELARDNAVNTVEALMRPFLTQNKDYELEVTL